MTIVEAIERKAPVSTWAGTPDEIETEIISAVTAVAEQAEREHWQGETPWTVHILSAVGQIGKRGGSYVCGGQAGDQGGYIYDHTWLKDHRMPLALECEWGSEAAVDDDFMKMVFGRADHRVMIFQAGRHLDEHFERLVDQVRECRCTQAGDRYLFLCWDGGCRKVEFRVFVA
jgi:hypothetical protein